MYQRGIERWLADLLQPLFDSLVAEKMVPSFVQVSCTQLWPDAHALPGVRGAARLRRAVCVCLPSFQERTAWSAACLCMATSCTCA